MKTVADLGRRIAGGMLAVAIAGLIAVPITAVSQEKGAQKLMKVQKVEDLQKVEAGDTVVMSCPKCKETYTQVSEKSFKTVDADELKKVPIHLCSSCDTRVVTKGTGKQAKNELVHTCKACGSDEVSCGVMKKNGQAAEKVH